MDQGQRINFSWLTRLRWGAVLGQLGTVVVVHWGLGVWIPFAPVLAIVAVEVLTNVAAVLWLRAERPIWEPATAVMLGLDVAFLTALLFFTGGPYNPFSFLYLVHIALAAVVLPARWTWALVGLSLAGSGALFFGDRWSEPLAAGGHVHDMRMHLQGMWIAFVVAAGFIVYFVTRVRNALADQRAMAVRNERLAALATLAAGAAHELATPLATIAVTARELQRRAEHQQPLDGDDVALIRAQVDRCRTILDHMATGAGESTGEPLTPARLDALVDAALTPLASTPGVDVQLQGCEAVRVTVPERALAQALRAIVKNAQEATQATGAEIPVLVTAARAGHALRLAVVDRGSGMSGDVLARAGEPFFTTKPPGAGMGLGLFLARALVERLGGKLHVRSAPQQGTSVTMELPA